MSIILFSNNAATTLAGAISNSSLTANLAAGSGALFPNPAVGQHFVMTFQDAATRLNNEIVWVTAIVGDTITMLRGQEGTTAQNWAAGDIASNFITAAQMGALIQPDSFAGNLLQNGNQQFPSSIANTPGLILQWGTDTIAGSSTVSKSFPEPFPNNCFVVVGSVGTPIDAGPWTLGFSVQSRSQYNVENTDTTLHGYNYFAIGN